VIVGVSFQKHPQEAIADGSAKDVTLNWYKQDEYNIFEFFVPIKLQLTYLTVKINITV
jgi:para-nitrobenzyl esterase